MDHRAERECRMASEEIKTVREMLAAFPVMKDQTIQQLRAQMEEWVGSFPLPEGVSVETVDANGVPAEWVEAPGAWGDTVFLYLHGGGYALGSLATGRHLAAAFSEAAATRVLSIDYRLAPEHPFPAAVNDAVAGFRWLVERGTSPEKVLIGGDSAGGGLSVATLVALRDAGDPMPSAGVCISPWVDLTCSSDTYRTKSETDPVIVPEDIRWLASLYLADQNPKTPLASPLFADLEGLPPLLIQVGSEEVLLDDAIGLDRRAREAGVESTLEVWEDMIHVWHVFFMMLKEGREGIARIGEYFKSRIP
jgi:phosphinothricin tripeptide acetyl hydrolase